MVVAMKVRFVVAVAAVLWGLTVAHAAEVGRTEVMLRESDVIYSGSESLELVLRVGVPPIGGTRVDLAWIEVTLDVDGEPEGFVPFLFVADAVLASGQGGSYEPAWPEAAREILSAPGYGRVVRLDATRLVRQWKIAGTELLLRLRVVEPTESARPPESIELSVSGGIVGKAVLVAR
jgi:hypothetical protein